MAINPDELRRVMAALGRKGGKARSKRKTEAARRNARKPRRRLCANCGASLTLADREAGKCTKCGKELKR